MKKLFFILTLCFLSISADLSATPKKDARRFSPATESVIGGILVGSATGLVLKALDYLSKTPIKPGLLACFSVIQGTFFGLNYYNQHPDRKRSKFLSALEDAPIVGMPILLNTGYTGKHNFFSLCNTAAPAVAAGYLTAIGCAAALRYNKDKISFIKIKDKDSTKTCSMKSFAYGAMLLASSVAGLATAHGVNKLL